MPAPKKDHTRPYRTFTPRAAAAGLAKCCHHPGVASKGSGRTTGTRLYAASRSHALKARALAEASNEHDRLDAAAHAGAAVELIAKAVLAELDLRLLHDRQMHHALLDIDVRDRKGYVPRPPSMTTTVGTSLAIELTARLIPGCRRHESAAQSVARTRNAAVHMALAPAPSQLEDLLSGMQAFTDAAATALRGASTDYWGVDFEMVREQRAASELDVPTTANAHVNGARSRYEDMVGALSPEFRESVVAEIRSRSAIDGDVLDEIECPACCDRAAVTWG